MSLARTLIKALALISVIIGRMFKVLHWPGGTELLTAGLLLLGGYIVLKLLDKELKHTAGVVQILGAVFVILSMVASPIGRPIPIFLMMFFLGLTFMIGAQWVYPQKKEESLEDKIEELGKPE